MIQRCLAIVATLGLLAGQTHAVDDDVLAGLDTASEPFAHMRVGYGVVPIPDRYTGSDRLIPGGPTFEYAEYMSEDTGNAVSVGIVGGRLDPFGPVIGLELVHVHRSQTIESVTDVGTTLPVNNETPRLKYRSFGPNLLAGVGLRATDDVHMEILGVLGVGGVRHDNPNIAMDAAESGSGWYWNTGVRAGAYLTIRRLVIGASVEYSHVSMSSETNWANANVKVEGEADGVGGRIEIGYRLQ